MLSLSEKTPTIERSRVVVGVLWIALALGVALRVYRLGDESVWFDEMASMGFLDEPSLGAALAVFQRENLVVQPLYAVLLYGYSRVAGTGDVSLRLFSVFWGSIAVVQIFFLGRKLYDAYAGCIAAIFMALITQMIYYSQEIRMYAFILVLAMISAFAFLKIMEAAGRHWWFVHFLATLAIAWTHAAALLLIAPQAIILLRSTGIRWRDKLAWCGAQALAALSLLIWWFVVRGDHETIRVGVLDQTPPGLVPGAGIPAYQTLLGFYMGWTGAAEHPMYDTWLTTLASFYGYVLLGGVFSAAAVLGVERWRHRGASAESQGDLPCTGVDLLLLWVVLPPLGLFLLSRFTGLDFFTRYGIHSAIPAYLLVGIAVSRYFVRARAYLVVALLGLTFLQAVSWERPYRVPLRQAAEYLSEHVSAESTVYLYQPAPDLVMLQGFGFHSRNYAYDIETVGDMEGVSRVVEEAREADQPHYLVLVGPMPVETENIEEFLAAQGTEFEMYMIHAQKFGKIRIYTILP